MLEAHLLAQNLIFGKFVGVDVADDGEMFACGLEVLAERKDVGSLPGQFFHRGNHFASFFSQAQHQTALGGDVGVSLLCAAQEFERALVERSFAYLAVEARDGFRVVVEDIGADGEDGIESVPVAAKVRDENLDSAAGHAPADLLDGAGEDGGAAIRLVVTIDTGDDGVAETEARYSFGDAAGLFLIRWTNGFAGRDGAEAAGAGADVAQNHEGGGSVFPALAHVGAAGGFADRVQVERAHDALELLVPFAPKEADTEPVRAGVRGGRRGGRNSIGNDVEGRGHVRFGLIINATWFCDRAQTGLLQPRKIKDAKPLLELAGGRDRSRRG